MTEESTALAVGQEVTQAAPDAAVSSPDRNFETEAHELGWVPEAEFKGPKEKWKPAQQFVEDGEKILPIVRSQLKREREEREREKADFQKRLDRIERMGSENLKRAKATHDAELERVRREQRAAVDAGDGKEFDRLEAQRAALEQTAPTIEPPADPNADLATRQEAWVKSNPWFQEDFDMHKFAVEYSDFHGRKHPNLSFEENMKVVEAEVRKKFPDKFGGKPAPTHSAVDGGGSFNGPPVKGGAATKLPAEARAQAEKDVAAGYYKTVDAWAKVYFGN